MPKHWRQCSYCSVNTFSRPDLTVFSLRTSRRSAAKFICELHFSNEDMKPHGTSKRLVTGATPLIPDAAIESESDPLEVSDSSVVDFSYYY